MAKPVSEDDPQSSTSWWTTVGAMDQHADEGRLPWGGEFGARVAQAREAAEMSEAEFTRRVRAYGLDFRQETSERLSRERRR
jgi:hypothetical protein